MRTRFWTGLAGAVALSALLVSPAAAQGGPNGRAADGGLGRGGGGFGGRGGGPPAAVSPEAARVADLSQEITLIRLLVQYRVPRETLEQLRDLIAQAFATLEAGDAVAARELSESRPLLGEAKRTILGGQSLDTPTPQEVAVAGTVNRLSSQREGFIRQLTQQVQQLLQSLPAEDRATLILVGQAMVRQMRAEQPFGGGPGGPGGGGPGGGGADRMGRDLDRLRNASPQDWERERTRFALQNAGIPGWWMVPGMIPGRGGPGGGGDGGAAFNRGRGLQGAGGGGGGRGEGGGGGRGGAGGGRGGPGGGRNFQPPNLNDPAVQARMKPFLTMADQARSMSPQAYQQARDKMAQQIEQQRALERVNAPVRDEEAIGLLGRILATKIGLEALEAKVGKATVAPPATG
jgi:hypothetical protein